MTPLNPSGLYAAYLRKSRRDLELEALGQGETLARHEKQLTELAQRLGIHIAQTYREIVSGDTISERPQIRRLLADVTAGKWDGVLAMDVDRFGRGDSIDQGVILQTFMYSAVPIITPDKIYDPTDDSDAEFFEIKLFFSRREYAMIKKRMQRGRLQSAMDGCYQSGRAPYGYEKIKNKGRKGTTLKIVPEQAEIIRSIYRWYADGMDGQTAGAGLIADKLNAMGVKNGLGAPWQAGTIRLILTNPVYKGKIRWKHHAQQIRIVDGQRVKSNPRNDHPLIVDGLHPAIIDDDLFDRIQAIFRAREKPHNTVAAPVQNPFAGLVVCSECGHVMTLECSSHSPRGILTCRTPHCRTSGTAYPVFEQVALQALSQWVDAYAQKPIAPEPEPDPTHEATEAARRQLTDQINTANAQAGRLYDLLEQGVYSIDVFRQRRAELDARLAALNHSLEALSPKATPDPIPNLIPRIRQLIDTYNDATPAEKNALLRSILTRIDYHKTQRNYDRTHPANHLTLTLHPKTPD